MNQVPFNYVISDSGTVTAYVKGRPYAFAKDHKMYDHVLDAIKHEDADEIVALGNVPKAIEDFGDGDVQVAGGVVMYKGKELHSSFTERILRHMGEGLPFKNLCLFLGNLMQNSSRHAVNELYPFLTHRNLPITTDGCFLAYKRVNDDYTDCHTSKIDNHIGCEPEMPRNEVDEEWRNACSSGFHVGAMEYVENFNSGTGRIMVVKVNPKDVVSVPLNECSKCRVCKYVVVDEMTEELMREVYEAQKGSVVPVNKPDCSTAIDDDEVDEDEDEDTCPNCDYDYTDCVCDDEEDDDEDWEEDEDEEEE